MRYLPAARSVRAGILAAFVAVVIIPGMAHALCDADCQSAQLAAHNAVRTAVNNGVQPGPGNTVQPTASPALNALTLDNAAIVASEAYALGCNFQHSPEASRPERGENLYASTGAPTANTPTDAVADWARESTLYTFGQIPAPNQNDVGHYTQIVWSSTTAVGCGINTCNVNSPFPAHFGPTWTIVVCQYSPPGNVRGQFPYQPAPPGAGIPRGPLDADGNGQYDALTDGILIMRYMFNIAGAALTANALGPGATVQNSDQALTRMNGFRPQYDIDGNGNIDALTDGLMILRFLFNITGPNLTANAIGDGTPTRTTPQAVQTYMQTLRP